LLLLPWLNYEDIKKIGYLRSTYIIN